MRKNITKLLACLAVLCCIGTAFACGDQDDSSSSSNPSNQSSASQDTDTDSSDTGSSDTNTDSSDTDSSDTDTDSSDTDSSDTDTDSSDTDSSDTDTDSSDTDSSDTDTDSSDTSSEDEETYTVKFVNFDGSVLSEKTYKEGETVDVPATPTKPADETYTYTFAGWDKEIVAVAEDVTYTAMYAESFIEYTVAFLDEDGAEISTATYHYGEAIVAPDETTLVKEDTVVYTYTFAAWDKEVAETVSGDVTYTATYQATLKEGVTANEVTAQGDGFVLGAGSIGGGANYVQGQQYDDGDETPSYVRQSYLAIDGNYGLDDYIVFDFTGKNMPEIAFFAKNYNDSMYAEGTSKQGIVVTTGITMYNGEINAAEEFLNGSKGVSFDNPFMIKNVAEGWFKAEHVTDSKLARANLVDDAKYRVIIGFAKGSQKDAETIANGITLKWALYDRETNELVEQGKLGTWNFFTGSNAQVGNMTLEDLVGSIVLYGKFGTECTVDKVWGVYENTTVENVADGMLNNRTYTISFQDEKGNELQNSLVKFGEMPVFTAQMPTLEKTEDALFTYAYAWEKAFVGATCDETYKLTVIATAKDGYKAYNTTAQGDAIVLGNGSIGNGANYMVGQNNGGYVDQAYFGIEGEYGLDNYIVFDFTGKNMPEVAFFAKNYNNSMYAEGTSKQGIVVVTGITDYTGENTIQVNSDKPTGKVINYDFPYMIQSAANGAFCQDAHAESKLGRENLVDNTHYRVIMGFTAYGENAIELKWCLYNLDTNTIVEEGAMHTWNFFTGSNAQVGNMTINDLVGSIVLYGKFGTSCTIDKLYGVESGAYADVVAKYTTNE